MKIFELIQNKINLYRVNMCQTYTDKNQFKINYKSDYIIKHLNGVYNKIFKYYSFINCKVKYDGNTFFVELSDDGFIFKLSDFNLFQKKYLNSVIDYLTYELTETELNLKSTDKFDVLIFEWEIECKQKLLNIYKNIYNENYIN